MSAPAEFLFDESGLNRLLDGLALDIAAQRRAGVPMRLIGVRTRGVPIAVRLAERLSRDDDEAMLVGAVDITLYRDDIGQRHPWPVLRGTEIPFDVEDCDIVLVDDVLHTGRTARAALNAVCDLGRPARVLLAVIVERAGRELPLRADCVATRLDREQPVRVLVRMRETDPIEGILQVAADNTGVDHP